MVAYSIQKMMWLEDMLFCIYGMKPQMVKF